MSLLKSIYDENYYAPLYKPVTPPPTRRIIVYIMKVPAGPNGLKLFVDTPG